MRDDHFLQVLKAHRVEKNLYQGGILKQKGRNYGKRDLKLK